MIDLVCVLVKVQVPSAIETVFIDSSRRNYSAAGTLCTTRNPQSFPQRTFPWDIAKEVLSLGYKIPRVNTKGYFFSRYTISLVVLIAQRNC